jgi:hypothetical protein
MRPNQPEEKLRFDALVSWAVRSTHRPLLLILDQFEEYFLYRGRERMVGAEDLFGDLLSKESLAFHLLLSLREDALHRLDEFRSSFPGILDTTVRLDHLDDSEVTEAIAGPIGRYNSEFRPPGSQIEIDPGLAKTVIGQLKETETGLGQGRAAFVEERQIELPYLQLALTKLWEAEGGDKATKLRASTLIDSLGGVRQIVRDHVNNVMDTLPEVDRTLCARIFDRLVTGVGSKIAYPTDGLAAEEVAGPGVTPERVDAVLGRLAQRDARLVRPVATAGLPGFEIVHDVLGVPLLEWRRRYEEAQRAEYQRRETEKQLREVQQEARRQRKRSVVLGILLGVAMVATGAAAAATWLAYNRAQMARSAASVAETAAREARTEKARAETAARNAEHALGGALWAELDFSGALRPDEVDGLWSIVSTSGPTRAGFVDRLASDRVDPATLFRFGRQPALVERALGFGGLTPGQIQMTLAGALVMVEQTTDADQLTSLAGVVTALAPRLNEEQVQTVLSHLLAKVIHTSDASQLPALASAVGTLAPRLSDEQVQVAFTDILTKIDANADLYRSELLRA